MDETTHLSFPSRRRVSILCRKSIDKLPPTPHKTINNSGHILDRHTIRHQRKQPSIQKTLRNDIQFLHPQKQITHPDLNQLHNSLLMFLQIDKSLQINHPQLLLLHQIRQSPKSLTHRFDMIQQHPRQHINPLHIPHLSIVYRITHQHISQHRDKITIDRKCRTLWIGPQKIFLYLL